MRLTKLVPALGLFAAIAAPVSAIELADGTLSIGAEVSAGFKLEFVDGDASQLGFYGEAVISLGYRVGEDVQAFILIESGRQSLMDYGFDSEDLAEAEAEGLSSADIKYLDEAYITWAFADNVSLTIGKYANWIGYQPLTINDSLTANLEGNNSWGLALGYSMPIDDSSSFEAALHIVNDIWTESRRPTELAYAASFGYSNDAFGTVGASISFDKPYQADAIVGFNLFAELDALVDDFIFGFDFHYVDLSGTDNIAAMGYVNYTLATPFPSSATLAVSMHDDDEDTDLLVQLAWLTNPTSNENFEVNFEFGYFIPDADGADDVITIGIEFVAILP
ncbi:MAG: hypothetical protein EA402_08195 [Planctomycetota bacterium]|nr:MAG: hypothetical protein EA402_08195 [Planctomycetota bacterium]